MCLVTKPKERRTTVVREDPYYAAPRPVSNYHGGPARARSSSTYVRKTVSTVPAERDEPATAKLECAETEQWRGLL
ncbi:hypothetical protein LTR17_017917 [Elasticomyces elasticus]|nr:hypothetical protein LTR17_017917 [Elasticomyces elasticus]